MLLTCIAPILINLTTIPFNKDDYRQINYSKNVCKTQYKGCMTKFTKTEPLVYRVICKKP